MNINSPSVIVPNFNEVNVTNSPLDSEKEEPILIIAPCYNENITAIKFLVELNEVLAEADKSFLIVLIDDASTDDTLKLLKNHKPTAKNVQLRIISLKYNQGHQGAIYQGLLYAQSIGANNVIVMDSDGEDDPMAVLDLVKFQKEDIDIINVERGKRKEKVSFRIFYKLYKIIFYLITTRTMKYGNYCMINKKIIDSTVETSFIHFAAHLSKQKAKTAKIVFDRRRRIDGKSKMNLNNLVHHAFKSFIEYAEDLLMIFLKMFLALAAITLSLVGYVLYQKLFTDNTILGWASTLSASLFNTALICFGFFVMGILLLNILGKKEMKSKDKMYQLIK